MDQQCRSCGVRINPSVSFCPQCGASQRSAQDSEEAPSVVTPSPAQNDFTPHIWQQEESRGELTRPRASQAAMQGRSDAHAPSSQLRSCPFCAEPIRPEAIKCRFCGEIVDPTRRQVQAAPQSVVQNVNVATPVYQYAPPMGGYQQRQWSPGAAALLSFLIPGLGQLYKGRAAAGVIWFFVVAIGYAMLIVPGIILHIICICTAASGNTYQRGG